MKKTNSLNLRLLSNIKINNNNCWLWQGAKNQKGYGKIKFINKIVSVHRASWMIYRGDIPENIHVCHHCDVPNCINPKHLFLGTNKDNLIDCANKNRTNKPKGEKNPNSKLSSLKVYDILSSDKSNSYLSNKYGVSIYTIKSVKKRKTWSHLTGALNG